MGVQPAEAMLVDLVNRGGIKRVQWALETAHPGSGGRASMGGDFARLVLVVRGCRRVLIAGEKRPQILSLSEGDCLVLGPHSWLVTTGEQSYTSVGAVLEARNPRLVMVTQEGRVDRRRPRPPSAPVEILPGLCDDTTMMLTSALLAAGPDGGESLYVRRLAETLWLRIAGYRVPDRPVGQGKANVTYGAAEHFVRDNLSQPVDRKAVARFLRISPSHVTRLFLRFAGESFGGYLLRVRLEGARKLLADPRLTVSEIAYLVGFTSPNYFVRAYRQRYGITPGRDRGAVSPDRPSAKKGDR